MLTRVLSLVSIAALLTAAAPAHKTKRKAPPPPPIALVLNGTRLPVTPSPIVDRGIVFVPVREILQALGLDFSSEGGHLITHVGANVVTITGGRVVKNTLYAPLRFFADALDAQTQYSRQTNSVEIVSTLIGRSGNGIVSQGGGTEEFGTVGAVDLDSSPPTVTLTHNASVRTLRIRSDVDVLVQDVSTGTTNGGVLQDVHPGDFAQVRLDRGGEVKQIIDGYGSLSGRVAGVGSGSVVLDDGHVVTPTRESTITLNGANATIDALRVNDEVMVRYNIDSSEVREVIATRQSTGSPPPSTGVSITSITFSPQHPLRKGDKLDVTLNGTPGGGIAHYDIGPYVRNLGLHETSPGVYTGTYTVNRNINVARAPLFGHLRVGNADAPVTQSAQTVSIATEPPAITDFAPSNGDEVNDPNAAIYATFAPGTVPVNQSSETIKVNGHDVTASAERSASYIEYIPDIAFHRGTIDVTVSVSDTAGNRAVKTWSFTVR